MPTYFKQSIIDVGPGSIRVFCLSYDNIANALLQMTNFQICNKKIMATTWNRKINAVHKHATMSNTQIKHVGIVTSTIHKTTHLMAKYLPGSV